MTDITPQRVTELIAEGYQLFDEMTQERHIRGQVEYGAYTFLDPSKNLIEEAMQELADCSNYVRYLFAKMHLLNTVLSSALGDKQVNIGPQAFRPSKPDVNG